MARLRSTPCDRIPCGRNLGTTDRSPGTTAALAHLFLITARSASVATFPPPVLFPSPPYLDLTRPIYSLLFLASLIKDQTQYFFFTLHLVLRLSLVNIPARYLFLFIDILLKHL